jgi:hypothetical protein
MKPCLILLCLFFSLQQSHSQNLTTYSFKENKPMFPPAKLQKEEPRKYFYQLVVSVPKALAFAKDEDFQLNEIYLFGGKVLTNGKDELKLGIKTRRRFDGTHLGNDLDRTIQSGILYGTRINQKPKKSSFYIHTGISLGYQTRIFTDKTRSYDRLYHFSNRFIELNFMIDFEQKIYKKLYACFTINYNRHIYNSYYIGTEENNGNLYVL